jgi:hypothetical protein
VAIFQPFEILWRDETYTVPPEKILAAIAIVEEHMTIADLARDSQSGSFRMSRVARAWGALLRFCGSRVTDEDVYGELFQGDSDTMRKRLVDSVGALLTLLVPPPSEVAVQQKGKPAPARVATARLSRRSTKR